MSWLSLKYWAKCSSVSSSAGRSPLTSSRTRQTTSGYLSLSSLRFIRPAPPWPSSLPTNLYCLPRSPAAPRGGVRSRHQSCQPDQQALTLTCSSPTTRRFVDPLSAAPSWPCGFFLSYFRPIHLQQLVRRHTDRVHDDCLNLVRQLAELLLWHLLVGDRFVLKPYVGCISPNDLVRNAKPSFDLKVIAQTLWAAGLNLVTLRPVLPCRLDQRKEPPVLRRG